MAIRNIPLFVFSSLPIIASSFKDVISFFNIKFKIVRTAYKFSPVVAVVLTIVVIFFTLRVLTNSYYISNRRFIISGLGLHESVHPVMAADFLKINNLNGKILNDLNSGSWLIWRGPQKVFIDGRLEVMKERFFLIIERVLIMRMVLRY